MINFLHNNNFENDLVKNTFFSEDEYDPFFYSNSPHDLPFYIIENIENSSHENLMPNKYEEIPDKIKKDENEFCMFPKPILSLDEEKNIKIPNIHFSQNDRDKCEEKCKPQKKVLLTSTSSSSERKSKNGIKKLLFLSNKKPKIHFPEEKDDSTLPSYFRMDMAKKHFKVRISQFATDTLNKLIKESILYETIRDSFHLPNSKLFTSKVTECINYKSLNYTIKDIFIIGKDTEELQRKNFKTISKIYKIFEKYEKLPENLKKVKDFLEMRFEDLIKMFYDSVEFNTFKNDKKTIFFDDGTKAQEGFSLLEDYGLIKLFKLLKKKRKRN